MGWKCNASCSFCGTNSDPSRNERLDRQVLIEFIRSLKNSQPRLTYVELTGGEPFLEVALLRDAARELHALGIPYTVVSNGFWGRSREEARRRLSELPGLERIVLSTDSYHRAFVPEDSIVHCLCAAADLGIEGFVSYSYTALESPGLHLLGEELQRALNELPHVGHHFCPAFAVGKGRVDPHALPRTDAAGPCMILSRMMVSPMGDAYACCVAGSYAEGGMEPLRLGKISGKSENDLHQRFLAHPLAVALAAIGPSELLAAKRGVAETGSHQCICSACAELQAEENLPEWLEGYLGDSSVRAVVEERMEALYNVEAGELTCWTTK